MSESEKVLATESVSKALLILGEHFDAVQILATVSDGDGTERSFKGSGNWYARQGMAHDFINADIHQDAAEQIANKLNEH